MTSGVNGESWPTVSGGKVGDPGIICDDEVGLPKDGSKLGPVGLADQIDKAIITTIILAQWLEFRRLTARAHEYDVCANLVQEQADKPLVAVKRPITHSRIAERGNDNTLARWCASRRPDHRKRRVRNQP